MELMKPTVTSRLLKTFQINKQQLNFGGYAAELSFYILWAFVPIMLALANVIAVLPMAQEDIIQALQTVLPDEVEGLLVPILTSYLQNTSSSIFSLGLIISLWPASNVFNTLQRVLNTIYKARPRKNYIFSRGFAYLFTLAMVLLIGFFNFVLIFGESIIKFIQDYLKLDLSLIHSVVARSWLIGIIGMVLLMILIYQVVPNVKWPIKYSIPGAIVATVGFTLVSQLFTLYLATAGRSLSSNATIGVFIILMIWLYFNGMVIAVGAYVNVFYHDFKERSYWSLVAETTTYRQYSVYSDEFREHSDVMPVLRQTIYKKYDKRLEGERYE